MYHCINMTVLMKVVREVREVREGVSCGHL